MPATDLATIKVTQPGAAITLGDQEGGVISSADAGAGDAHPLTVTALLPAGVLAAECRFALRVVDQDLHATQPLIGVVSPGVWTVTFPAGTWGNLVLELSVERGGTKDKVTKRFSVPSPTLGLVYPAAGERVHEEGGSNAQAGSVQKKTWYNPAQDARPIAKANRELVVQMEGVWGRSTASATANFTNADLVAGVYTFAHGLNAAIGNVVVKDNTGKVVGEDDLTIVDNNTLAVDLGSFGAITGTWSVTVYAGGP